MAATSTTIGSGDPDTILIGELIEEVSRRPPAIMARKLLIEHYIAIGWIDAALDNSKELELLTPGDLDVARFLRILEKKPQPPALEKLAVSPPQRPTERKTTDRLIWDLKTGRYKKESALQPSGNPQANIDDIGNDLDAARRELVEGYQALRARAGFVLDELVHLQALQKKASVLPSKNTVRIQRIVQGQADASAQQCTPRAIARAMRDNPKDAIDIMVADMEEAVKLHNKLLEPKSATKSDGLRDALVKRKTAIEVALPDELRSLCQVAFMHMEHELLDRNYTNTETMYGDAVKAIPRSKFLVTEDNYAWDMEELVAAIKAGSGVLRNPLSKQLFTPGDIRDILMHPLAVSLAALAVEQKEMSKGVRPETITRMEKLSSILLEDQSADTLPSRHAVDEFLAYVATCTSLSGHALYNHPLTY